jgi:hypothetical protein
VSAQKTEDDLIEFITGFRHDPLGFVLGAFDWGQGELEQYDGPDQWQRDLLDDLGRRLFAGEIDVQEAIQIAVASGHGIGKSAIVAWLILWAISTMEDTRGVVTANTEKQLTTKTWPELAKWYRLCITRHWFTFTATAIFSVDPDHQKTWRIDQIPWSDSNTDAFAGLHNQGKRILVIFDEASQISDKIWEVTEGALTDSDTEIIWCCFGNPTQADGRFRECFRRFRHRWITKQIDSRTVKISNKEQIRKWIEDYGEDSDFVKVRVRGLFPSMSAKQFFNAEDVEAAYGRHLHIEQFDFAPKILVCDPAWEGDDFLEIGLRQGLAFKHLRTIPKNDNDIQIATILAQYEDEEQADAVFIDAGYGTGIVSAGNAWGRDWTLVWFGSASSDPGYLNRRAQMAGDAKKWLKDGGALPAIPAYRDELLTPQTIPRPDGKIQLESKKEIKKRLGYSPGKFDLLLLSFAYPVTKKNPFIRKATADYDPAALLEMRGRVRREPADYDPYAKISAPIT